VVVVVVVAVGVGVEVDVVGSQMPITQLTIALQITEQMIRQHNYRQ